MLFSPGFQDTLLLGMMKNNLFIKSIIFFFYFFCHWNTEPYCSDSELSNFRAV